MKCPKHEDGCKAELRRCEVQDHMNIYCGYALVECELPTCASPVRRKDAAQGCLHYGVSCLSCHRELEKWKLEIHWRSECPDRKVHCDMCQGTVFYRDMEEHSKGTCPAISIPCPGRAIGCTSRNKHGQAEIHAKSCTFAKLAPALLEQQERLNQQEKAQKEMSRKLEVLEGGFASMQNILYGKDEGHSDRLSADSSRLPYLRRSLLSATTADSATPTSTSAFDFPLPPTDRTGAESPTGTMHTALSSPGPPERAAPSPPGPRPSDLPEPFSSDFDLSYSSPPQPAANGGPYASPLHHLLSMHESLRDEIGRVSAALSELDGRHSMQTLNENLRTREEISYIGAQMAGLGRQVHWLTSVQLQRQQQGRGSPNVGGGMGESGAGAGVEAAVSAVSTAATALRGMERMVDVGSSSSAPFGPVGLGMRRGPSEEGRTKL